MAQCPDVSGLVASLKRFEAALKRWDPLLKEWLERRNRLLDVLGGLVEAKNNVSVVRDGGWGLTLAGACLVVFGGAGGAAGIILGTTGFLAHQVYQRLACSTMEETLAQRLERDHEASALMFQCMDHLASETSFLLNHLHATLRHPTLERAGDVLGSTPIFKFPLVSQANVELRWELLNVIQLLLDTPKLADHLRKAHDGIRLRFPDLTSSVTPSPGKTPGDLMALMARLEVERDDVIQCHKNFNMDGVSCQAVVNNFEKLRRKNNLDNLLDFFCNYKNSLVLVQEGDAMEKNIYSALQSLNSNFHM